MRHSPTAEMKEPIDIVLVGLDVPAPKAAQGIARVFGIEPHTARLFVQGLPRVVRRAATPDVAERYAEALRSIGARVECRPSLPPPLGAHAEPALPAPTPAWMAEVMKSRDVERATQDAVERFRAAEGISPSMDPRLEAGALIEVIPKAPLVPHDMDRMPNASLPRWSTRPFAEASPYSAAPPRAHSNADLPPSFGLSLLDDPEPTETPVQPPPVRPGPVGLAPAATTFQRRSSPVPMAPRAHPKTRDSKAQDTSAHDSQRVRLLLFALVAAAAGLWLALR